MIRRSYAFAVIALLAVLVACGGGGKGGSSLPPTATQPASKKTGVASFKVKLPGKATMAKVRRNYQSPATQGISIDWSSTNPYAPDYSAPISAACPSTNPSGVTLCTPDPDGGTDYTFQIPIPAGTYTLTVSAFDKPPSGSPPTFAASANMLVQGQLGGVTITGGTSNTVANITFYGIPASVSFVPAPGQSHVVQYGGATVASSSAPQVAVVGNNPQSFYAEPLDADGYVISNNDGNNNAPTVSVTETTSDACHASPFTTGVMCFSVAQPAPSASPYLFTLQAQAAYGSAVIAATATLPNGATPNGTNATTTQYNVLPVQEIWTTQSAGIYGYPLYPSPGPSAQPLLLGNPIDSANDYACEGPCSWGGTAMDASNNLWAINTSNSEMYEFTTSSGAQALNVPSSPTSIALPGSPQSVAIDASGYMYIPDASTGDVYVYNTQSGSTMTTVPFVSASSDPRAVAVAPLTAPNGAAGTIWVGGTSPTGGSTIVVYSPYSSGMSTLTTITSLPNAPEALAFDTQGDLWVYDGTTYSEYTIGSGYTLSAAVISEPEAAITYAGAQQMALSAQQVLFIGSVNAPSPTAGFGISYAYSGGTGPASQNIQTVSGLIITP